MLLFSIAWFRVLLPIILRSLYLHRQGVVVGCLPSCQLSTGSLQVSVIFKQMNRNSCHYLRHVAPLERRNQFRNIIFLGFQDDVQADKNFVLRGLYDDQSLLKWTFIRQIPHLECVISMIKLTILNFLAYLKCYVHIVQIKTQKQNNCCILGFLIIRDFFVFLLYVNTKNKVKLSFLQI